MELLRLRTETKEGETEMKYALYDAYEAETERGELVCESDDYEEIKEAAKLRCEETDGECALYLYEENAGEYTMYLIETLRVEGGGRMKLSKWCQGCKCASCRWQGTDNCLHDRNKPCRSCNGVKQCVAVYIPIAYGCKGYEKQIIIK